jgi:hypothetical protein
MVSELNRSKEFMKTALEKAPFSLFPHLLLFLFLVSPCSVFAHRLDEYLQATLVVIEPSRVRLQMNLTPGVAVAEGVLAQIDIDHDGVISTNEAAAYSELLNRDLTVRIDQRNLELKTINSYFPGLDELRSGWGFIQIEFVATLHPLSRGAHKLTIENRHFSNLSVYLLNATRPASSSIQIGAQVRNQSQSTAQIQFTFQPPPGPSKAVGLVALLAIVLVSVALGARSRETNSPRID